MTAQENIARMPAYCWSVLPSDNSLIRIKAGELGYYPLNQALTEDAKRVFDAKKSNDEIANELNAEAGISLATRRAMEHGSMFGWETGLAFPEKWEEILKRNQR